jgi:hypothetical protein
MGALTGKGKILDELDRVFSNPSSNDYDRAQRVKHLFEIADSANNWRALVNAYRAAGVGDDQHWRDDYLRYLTTTNIYRIAKARLDGLTEGVAMKTYAHPPATGRDVVVSRDTDGSIIIDSPYPVV